MSCNIFCCYFLVHVKMVIFVLHVTLANTDDRCDNSNQRKITTSNNNNLFDKFPLELQLRLLKGLSLKELAMS